MINGIIKETYNSTKSMINDLTRLTREDKYIYRGISRENELLPGLCRKYDKRKQGLVNLSGSEFELLYQFKQLSSNLISGNLEVLDMVACAQHYGIPTRFLDWTRNPFVALYFAVSENSNPDHNQYALYFTKIENNIVIHRHYDQTHETGGEFIVEYRNFIDAIKNKDRFIGQINFQNRELQQVGVKTGKSNQKGLIIFDSGLSNSRIIAQSGLFSIPASIENDDAAKEIEENTQKITITLSASERKELLQFLDNMGYNKLRLFPDLQNLCEYIVQETLEEA